MADADDDFVQSIGDMINYFMDLRGMPETDCNALAAAVTDEIRTRYQGERVTIRKNPATLAEQVRAAFTGDNIDDLAVQFGISRASVYRYCKK